MRLVAVLVCLAGCDAVFGLTSGTPPPDAAPPVGWAHVAFGTNHACGIRADGSLWCWGRNDDDQLGLGSEADPEVDTPTQVGTATWSVVATGALHTCAIDTDEHMWCWGSDQSGQLGDAASVGFSSADQPLPQQVGTSTWIAVAAGQSHTCAIDTDKQLWCWGDNNEGQINGMPGQPSVAQPPTMAGPTPSPSFASLAAGDDSTFVLDTDGHLWTFGANYNGELGTGNLSHAPIAEIGTDGYSQIAASVATACAVRVDGHLRCWGAGARGALGNDDDHDVFTPTDISADTTWAAVAVGGQHACGIHVGGAVDCWGDNSYDQLATTTTDGFLSTPTPLGASADALVLGLRQTCTLAGGVLQCAGSDGGGQLGTGGGSRREPVEVGHATKVAVGRQVTCAIDANTLTCWGDNSLGSVGDGTPFDRDVGVSIGSPGGWQGVTAGDHVCAIDLANQLWCWGYDGHDAVGVGAGAAVPSPVEPVAMHAFGAAAASQHTCAIDGASELWCWGLNDSGQAGDLAMGSLAPPAQATGGTWSQVAVGSETTCAIDNLSALSCWGNNNGGVLGDNGAEGARAMPAPVQGVGSVDVIAVGGYTACARTAGTFMCWGANDHGQLGDMTTDPRTVPGPAPGSFDVLSLGLAHACGIDGGKLFCWGANEHGQLGDNTLGERHKPVQVGSDADWASVFAGDDHTCGLKQGGDLYCWGRDIEGEIGDGAAWRATFAPIP